MALIRCGGGAAIDAGKIFGGLWNGTSANQVITSKTLSQNFSGANTSITIGDVIFTCVDAYQIKCNKSGKLWTSSLDGVAVTADTVFTRTGSESGFIFIID